MSAGVVAGTAPAGAWPGDPDGTWGSCGVRANNVVGSADTTGVGALLQGDGKVVVGGVTGPEGFIARFNADGAYDAGFGTSGRRRVASGTQAAFAAVAQQPDGRIVGAGSTTTGGASDTLLARVTTNGTLDPSFSGDGVLVTDFGGGDSAAAVRVQGDGNIVVGGTAGSGGFVARYTTSGGADPSFDSDGKLTGLPMTVQAIALQADGKIVLAGATAAAGADFALLRLNPDGSVDSSFGGASGVTTDFGGYDVVTALALQSDGKVVVTGAGHGAAGSGHTIVARYASDGTVDSTFTTVDQAFGMADMPASLALRVDGKIIVSGNSKVGSDNDLLVARFNGDGSADAGFGIGGVTLEDEGASSRAQAVLVLADGRPLVVGSVRQDGHDRLARFGYQADLSSAAHPARGFVLDAFGGLHGFSAGCVGRPAAAVGSPSWPGRDVARGVALMAGGRGFVVDGSGALHKFRFGDGSTAGMSVHGVTRWRGVDVARGIAIVPQGTGGLVLDAFGGLHPFSIGSGVAPVSPTGTPYWSGWDIARGVALLPDNKGGYVLDGYGGLHRFGQAPNPTPGGPYWSGADVARAVTIAPDGSGGWILDLYGGLHPFGIGGNPAPPTTVGGPYWAGWAVARGAAALP